MYNWGLSLIVHFCYYSVLFCFFREGDGYCRALGNNAFGGYRSIVKHCGVLDYRKAEACAADFTGAALVNAVKPLENALALLLGNSDARIAHADNRPAAIGAHRHMHAAAGAVIFYGVVAKVKYNAFQKL